MDFGEKLIERKRTQYRDKTRTKDLINSTTHYSWEPFEQKYGLIRMWYVRELERNNKKFRKFERSYSVFRLMRWMIKFIYICRLIIWYITNPV